MTGCRIRTWCHCFFHGASFSIWFPFNPTPRKLPNPCSSQTLGPRVWVCRWRAQTGPTDETTRRRNKLTVRGMEAFGQVKIIRACRDIKIMGEARTAEHSDAAIGLSLSLSLAGCALQTHPMCQSQSHRFLAGFVCCTPDSNAFAHESTRPGPTKYEKTSAGRQTVRKRQGRKQLDCKWEPSIQL